MGQIFDKLCQVAEQGLLPEGMFELLRDAKLFEFEGRAQDVLPKVDFSGKYRQTVADLFFLPFSTIVIEDSASLALFVDIEEDALGIHCPRFVLECQFIQASRSEEFGNVDSSFLDPDHQGALCVTWGQMINGRVVDPPSPAPVKKRRLLPAWLRWLLRMSAPVESAPVDTSNREVEIKCDFVLMDSLALMQAGRLAELRGERRPNRNKDRKKWVLLDKADDRQMQEIGITTGKNLMMALREIAMYNLPQRWVVKKTRVKKRQPVVDSDRLLRTDQRPTYLLMELREFRERIGEKLTRKAGEKETHDRRAHPRLLSSPRYTHKQGQWIRVKATVVGRTEGTTRDGKWLLEVLVDR